MLLLEARSTTALRNTTTTTTTTVQLAGWQILLSALLNLEHKWHGENEKWASVRESCNESKAIVTYNSHKQHHDFNILLQISRQPYILRIGGLASNHAGAVVNIVLFMAIIRDDDLRFVTAISNTGSFPPCNLCSKFKRADDKCCHLRRVELLDVSWS